MVPTISLPFVSRGSVQCDGIYTPRVCDVAGLRTPTTVSPISVYALSPTSSPQSFHDYHNAFSDLQGRYDLLTGTSKLIGSGGNGCVWSAKCKSSDLDVAVKSVSKPAYRSTQPQESDILRIVQRIPGVVRLFDVFQDDDYEILVMEFCEGRDLQQWKIGELRDNDCKLIVKDLLACLREIHSRGVSHMDVRLENVIVNAPRSLGVNQETPCVRLVDFGSGVSNTKLACNDLIGTGKLLFELVAGLRIGEQMMTASEMHAVQDSAASDLIDMLLSATPTNYSDIAESATNHPWFH